MLTMTRSKVTFELEDRYKRALAIYAAEWGLTIGEAIAELVAKDIPEFLARADKAIAEGRPSAKPRRGRKPKPD